MPPARPKPKPAPARSNPSQAATIGASDKGSRAKADAATRRAESMEGEVVPLTADGRPMVNIQMSAAELIPTGQYANVSVGPAKISWWIDPQDPAPISDAEKQNVAKALNDIAEICEVDVISVQRNLVLESIQATTE